MFHKQNKKMLPISRKKMSLEEIFPNFYKDTLDIPSGFVKGRNEILFKELVLTWNSIYNNTFVHHSHLWHRGVTLGCYHLIKPLRIPEDLCVCKQESILMEISRQ